jgi:DNA-binding beta-propeller fold protein YncE
VANFGSNNVTKLSLAGAVLGTFAAGNGPSGIAFDGANIWVADFNSTTVTKLLATTGATVSTFTVGTEPQGVAFDGANIWVSTFGGTTVSKL